MLQPDVILDIQTDAQKTGSLKAGMLAFVNGVMYTARDQAHKRLAAAIERGEPLPINLQNAAIYYCGPTPAQAGRIIGSCGPTTSARMDKFTPILFEHGLKFAIGKGERSQAVTAAIKKHGGAYLTAIGGAAAFYQSKVTACELVAYPDLGCEAIYKLTVKDFPAFVTIV